jgi:hypothetical protein
VLEKLLNSRNCPSSRSQLTSKFAMHLTLSVMDPLTPERLITASIDSRGGGDGAARPCTDRGAGKRPGPGNSRGGGSSASCSSPLPCSRCREKEAHGGQGVGGSLWAARRTLGVGATFPIARQPARRSWRARGARLP